MPLLLHHCEQIGSVLAQSVPAMPQRTVVVFQISRPQQNAEDFQRLVLSGNGEWKLQS
jgi:hypothetical protein